MGKKYWLSFAGLSLAAFNYMMVRAISHEPQITRYAFQDPNWKGEEPLKLALVSDFHGGSGIWSGPALRRIIENEAPDAVMVAGDHFDAKYAPDNGLDFFEGLATRVPTFFVTGNNEEILSQRYSLLEGLRARGVHVLEHSGMHLTLAGQAVSVVGLNDVCAYRDGDEWIWAAQQVLLPAEGETDAYRILLSHRPERTDFYNQTAAHLVLCGHTHGGQWRLPVLGGVFAPHQHIFPRYDKGLFRLGRRHRYVMAVGAGFDVHPFVPRLFNRPELVILTVSGIETITD